MIKLCAYVTVNLFIEREVFMFKLFRIEIKHAEPEIIREYEKDGFHFHETVKKGRKVQIKIIPPWSKTKRN